MPNTRSGAGQTLSVGGVVISGEDSGFGGVNYTTEASTYESESAGLKTSHDAGHQVNSGTFVVDETDESESVLLCQTGTRKAIIHNDGDATHNYNALLVVTRNFAPRGKRTFSVSMAIDGSI